LLCGLPAARSFARASATHAGEQSMSFAGIATKAPRGPDRAAGLLAERPEVGAGYRVGVTARFASSVEDSFRCVFTYLQIAPTSYTVS
jgi:hypothetical protein